MGGERTGIQGKKGEKQKEKVRERLNDVYSDKYEGKEMDVSPETITSPSAHSCCHSY